MWAIWFGVFIASLIIDYRAKKLNGYGKKEMDTGKDRDQYRDMGSGRKVAPTPVQDIIRVVPHNIDVLALREVELYL